MRRDLVIPRHVFLRITGLVGCPGGLIFSRWIDLGWKPQVQGALQLTLDPPPLPIASGGDNVPTERRIYFRAPSIFTIALLARGSAL